MKKSSKKFSVLLIFNTILASSIISCNKKGTLLDASNPVTLTMWHVYGEQADSPMNRYVDEFNKTIGKEKGVIINVTLMSNASQIGEKLLNAKEGKAGVPSMPDLFFCHKSNAEDIGINNLIDWKERFNKDELDGFVDSFLLDGTINDSLSILPVSKSTQLLFLASGPFERFAKEKEVSYDDLKTWDGFFEVAEKYYEYSSGKPFCALDYLIRLVELDAISKGANDFYNENGWYDDNEIILSSFTKFAKAIAKGHIVVSDLYSNTQVMTGETIAGLSSSAAVLYYNDKIVYQNNIEEDMNLKVFPVPYSESKIKYATQAGVGLSAYKTTEQKAEAETIFAKWFTDENRNLDFVAETGYMPIKKSSFDKFSNYKFKTENYKNTYLALKKTRENCTFISEPSIHGYYQKTYNLYDYFRSLQKKLSQMYIDGKSSEDITKEIVDVFYSLGK